MESRTELPLPSTHGLHHPDGQRGLHHGDRHVSETNGTYKGGREDSINNDNNTSPHLLPAPAIS